MAEEQQAAPIQDAVQEEQTEQLETQEAAPIAAPTVAEKKYLRKLQLKIDGENIDEELPFDLEDTPANQEWMKKNLQMSKVAQKRMQSEAQLQKEVRSFVDELRKNPRKVLSDPNLGVDLKEIARQIIEEEISNSQKSPEQIKQEALESELKELRAEREREKEEMSARELERLQQQEMERYDTQITKALSNSSLPKSPYVVKKMADYMLMSLNEGLDVTPDDILPLVEEEIRNDLKQMFAVLGEDAIEGLVGKEVINKMRKRNLAKAPPSPLKSSIKDIGTKRVEPKKEEGPKKTFKDFFKLD